MAPRQNPPGRGPRAGKGPTDRSTGRSTGGRSGGRDGGRDGFKPRREGSFDKPRREGGFDRPRDDRPRSDRPYGDRPRREGGFDKPRREGGFDKPRREGGFDRPRSDRPYGDRPQREGGFDRPRREGGFDRPRSDRPYGDRPRREGGFDKPRREGGFDKPRREGGFDRPREDRPYGDRPRREGGFDRPRRESGFDKPRREGGFDHPQRDGGFDRKPRRDDRHEGRAPFKGRGEDVETTDTAVEQPKRDQMRLKAGGRPSHRPNLYGMHAVRAAWLNPNRNIHALYLSEAAMETFAPVLEEAAKAGLNRPEPLAVSKDDMDRLFPPGAVHQGIALACGQLEDVSVEDLIISGNAKERSVIVMLDQVTDPHNVGAILRSASAFGATGVVMQKMHAPELIGVLAKTACGAVDHLDVAYETNLSRTLEKLKEDGYVTIGMDERGEKTIAELDRPEKCVIVLGAEGPGMRRLVRENCDVLVRLPTHEPIASLNVSNAAAVALYAMLA
ncbi:23S rRNA (guanosine(2251)-2'-O)-methyltransferase RlmB [Micavibrio aeruginosavorus]|uniref:RNA 2'-O ribose methyltransferase substrate binding family protein n=1 Tax=Micavibrio aeruginosavorus (strain ARL-13) TaxID=856793 RepID=G2KS21_MICAA|nr:23S rRNA (guanosine(2251)-2'-O)-methyltransferase RlmB [Micavibrio aeruginosavorus]AEP10529.1 RNA 2'-O ribose methyltransferase substrate binding family protein [Micavibrio aeruginosavorus ARL-13]